jgi:hypothetical protein
MTGHVTEVFVELAICASQYNRFFQEVANKGGNEINKIGNNAPDSKLFHLAGRL